MNFSGHNHQYKLNDIVQINQYESIKIAETLLKSSTRQITFQPHHHH